MHVSSLWDSETAVEEVVDVKRGDPRRSRRGSVGFQPASPAASRSEFWSRLIAAASPIFKRACCREIQDGMPLMPVLGFTEADDPDGICEAMFAQTCANEDDGLRVVAFDRDGLRFASKAFERVASLRTATHLKAKATNLPLLLAHHEKPEVQIKRDGWQILSQLHREVLGVPLNEKEFLRNRTIANLVPGDSPDDAAKHKIIYRDGTDFDFGSADFAWPEMIPMLSEDTDEEPFWQFVCAFGVVVEDVALVVWILLPLSTPVPALLWKLLHESEKSNDRRRAATILEGIISRLAAIGKKRCSDEHHGELLAEAERLCDHMRHAFDDEEAYAGKLLVPRVGFVSVEKYAHFGSLESELTAKWKRGDLSYGPADRHETNASEVAWTLADPEQLDCPLVYISPGFEDMTGYWRAFGLGRNARFVQPKDGPRNNSYNGTELGKLSEFCKQDDGHLLTLMLVERRTGQFIWQLLYSKHLMLTDPDDSSRQHHYIFGLHTDIYCQREAMADILPLEPTEASVAALKELRLLFQDKQFKFSYIQQSLHCFADEVICEWMLKSGRDCRTCYIEGNFAPRVGLPSVRAFRMLNPYQDLVKLAKPFIQGCHRPSPDVFAKTERDEEDGLPICISDPSVRDNPLVYVNRAWEVFTGYSKDVALARSCRFLQPAFGRINRVVNGEELARVRLFCENLHKLQSTDHTPTMLAFLLNEGASGERYWTFLYLVPLLFGSRRYVLAVSTSLEIHMPGVLMSREKSKWYDDEMGRTSDEWGAFITRLREAMRSKENPLGGKDLLGAGGLAELARFAKEQMLEYMKTCEDYEGDHFVPKIGMREVRMFKEGSCWQQVYMAVRADVRRLTENAHWDGQDLAFCVSDPAGPDCPLVHISRGFEELSGYHAEFALGRSCRFMQPKRAALNELFNGCEIQRVRHFCKAAAASLDEKSCRGPLPDKRMLTLLINTHRERFPFWNLLWLERVEACNKAFVVGVLTNVDAGGRLVELLAGDAAGMEQLSSLRALFLKRESCLSFESIKMVSKRCLEEWLLSYPPALELPRLACSGMPWPFPLVGLEISTQSTDMEALVDAMENGIRHFHIIFPDYGELKDELRHQFEARLMALRLAELLNRLRSHHLQYLRAGLCFSVRTPPHLVGAFSEIRKAVISNGMSIACWLLDARGASSSSLVECWQAMSHARSAGEVRVVGLYGGGPQAVSTVRSTKGGAPLSVYAAEMLPGLRTAKEDIELFGQVRAGGGVVMAFNIFGPDSSWLLSDHVQHQSAKLHCDPTILLLKWVEHHGFAAIVPNLGVELAADKVAAPPTRRRHAMAPGAAAASLSADPGLSRLQAPPRSRRDVGQLIPLLPDKSAPPAEATARHKKDWKPNGTRDHEAFHLRGQTLPPAQVARAEGDANVHRGFVRAYRQSPSAEVCSVALVADEDLPEVEVDRRRSFCHWLTAERRERPTRTADVTAFAQLAQSRRSTQMNRLSSLARLSTAGVRVNVMPQMGVPGTAPTGRAPTSAARDEMKQVSKFRMSEDFHNREAEVYNDSESMSTVDVTFDQPLSDGCPRTPRRVSLDKADEPLNTLAEDAEVEGRLSSRSGARIAAVCSDVDMRPQVFVEAPLSRPTSSACGTPASEHFPLKPVEQDDIPQLPPLVVLQPRYPSAPSSARQVSTRRRKRPIAQDKSKHALVQLTGPARPLDTPQGRPWSPPRSPPPHDRPNTRTAWQLVAHRAARAEEGKRFDAHSQCHSGAMASVALATPRELKVAGHVEASHRLRWQLLTSPDLLPHQYDAADRQRLYRQHAGHNG